MWLFELAAVTDPAAVPDAVASVLCITQQPGKSVTDSVAAALGLMIAQDSGNRAAETHLAGSLSRLAAEYGEPLAALDYFTLGARK